MELLLGSDPENSINALNSYRQNLVDRGQTVRAGQTGSAARKFEHGIEREEKQYQQTSRGKARESSGFQRTGLKVH